MSRLAPHRAELLELYSKAERFGRWWFALDLLLILSCFAATNFARLQLEPLEAVVLVGMSAGPTLLSLAYLFAQKKKLVEELREDAQFGKISKADLLEIIAEVCQRMNIPRSDIGVYVTAEKGVNAAALAVGLGWLVPTLRGVYLNRATIHALGKEELGTVIAHELAHIYRYPLYYQKGLFLHLITSATIALCIWSRGFHMMFALAGIGVYYFALNTVFGRYSRVVEHLCDDCGAEVIGVDAALRAEFLVAQHSATLSRAYQVALERKLSGQILSQRDIQNIIDESLSFDPTTAEELEREVSKRLSQHEDRSNTSFIHFLKGIVTSEGPDAKTKLEQRLRELKYANSIATIPLPDSEFLSKDWFTELIKRIEAQPQVALFPVPEELCDADSSHPSPRKRIAYLWLNFAEQRAQ